MLSFRVVREKGRVESRAVGNGERITGVKIGLTLLLYISEKDKQKGIETRPGGQCGETRGKERERADEKSYTSM